MIMNWEEARRTIKEEEKNIEVEIGLKIRVYGSGSQGYNKLSDFLNEAFCSSCHESSYLRYNPIRNIWECRSCGSVILEKLTRTIRKQMHEYWTFLILTRVLTKGYKFKGQKTLFYQPTRGRDSQHPSLVTPRGAIFIEPCLSGYNEKEIVNRYANKMNFLEETESRHVRPDLLITNTHAEIPWGVWLWHAGGLADEKEFYRQWVNFSPEVKFIVECKEETPTDKDLSQALWYSLAYRKPVLFILQEKIDQEKESLFGENMERIRESGQSIKLVENFKIGHKRECMEKVEFLEDLDIEM